MLRSWISQAVAAGSAAWVTVRRGERDPQQFWLSVLGALRQTAPGLVLVQPLTAAPDLDGWAIAERLLKDLAPLENRIYLVIDDLHELGPAEAQQQLELLMMRAPEELRFVLASRHDVRLGLHRLRLDGELAEIREPDLRFTVAEAEELLDAAGVKLPDPALLVERTEGWAAGLRLAALSLAGHPDPGRFAEEFSGTERTVAEYLLAEVLDRQPEPVRLLLLRTSVLERVNGELADLLTGDSGGERVLQDLEQANAFVVSLDARRSWFRYHHLFADLLQLELRRTAPREATALHRAAAGWFAEHKYPVDAVRHAQAARDWGLAARLLADHWYSLQLDGQAATTHQLLAGFPAGTRTADAELAALAAAEELAYGSLEAAERCLGLAERGMVPDARRAQAHLLLGITRLVLARQRWNLQAVAEEAQRLQAVAEASDAAQPRLGEELRALALISLGTTEFWAAGEDPERHLEVGVALARRIGRPFLEFTDLAYQAAAGMYQSFTRAAERGRQAIELAERHGWADEPVAGLAYVILGAMLAWQMRPGEAGPWVQRAERVLRAETEPAAVLGMHRARGMLELARGRDADALTAFQAAERLGQRHQDRGRGCDRRHGDEDGRPAVVFQQPAPHDRSGRDGHARDRPPQADRPGPFPPFGEDVGDQRQRRRERHRGAQPHHRPGRDQLRCGGGEPAGQASGPEHGQPCKQHSLAAEPVGQAAEGEQQRGEDQVVGVDHPLQLRSGGVQLAHHGRKRHVHQGRVQVDQERCQQQRNKNHGLRSHG